MPSLDRRLRALRSVRTPITHHSSQHQPTPRAKPAHAPHKLSLAPNRATTTPSPSLRAQTWGAHATPVHKTGRGRRKARGGVPGRRAVELRHPEGQLSGRTASFSWAGSRLLSGQTAVVGMALHPQIAAFRRGTPAPLSPLASAPLQRTAEPASRAHNATHATSVHSLPLAHRPTAKPCCTCTPRECLLLH